MALRVALGLFRLWVVASVLWVGGVGVVTWLAFPGLGYLRDPAINRLKFVPVDFDPFMPTGKRELSDSDVGLAHQGMSYGGFSGTGASPQFDPSKPYTVLNADGTAASVQMQTADRVIHEFPPDASNEEIYSAIRNYTLVRTVQTAGPLAFLPPAFVLAFGAALIWAFRGFRVGDI
jgi:hypothetical protein